MTKQNLVKKIKLPKARLKRPSLARLKSVKLLISLLLVGGLAIFAGSAYVWYDRIFSDTDRVFYGMLSRSLETDSITRTVSQKDSARTANQSYYIAFTPEATMESNTVIEQVGQDRSASKVVTRTIGQKDSDYVKYSSISIPDSQGGGSDFSKVLNQWAKRENNPESGEKAQFLNEAIFTFIPFGNFSQENRSGLIDLIKEKEVYKLSNSDISYQQGRPVMEMMVSINPKALVEVLQEYALLSGLGDKELLNPADYEKAADIGVTIKIDMLSRHLSEMNLPGQSRTETYGAYGINRKITIPSQTVSIQELQGRLQN